MARKFETSVRASAVLIPVKADFEAMNSLQGNDSLRSLCTLPCGQACRACSCHVSGQEEEERNFRF